MASKLKKPVKAFLHAIFSQATQNKGFNAIYKAVEIPSHGIDYKEREKFIPCDKNGCTVSSEATYNEIDNCAEIGVIIREGFLPISCVAARIGCTNSEECRALGIALGMKTAIDRGIYDFVVRVDSLEAYNSLQSTKILDEKHVTAIKLLDKARPILGYKNVRMSGKVVLPEENKAANFLSRIAATMKKENEKTWETRVPRGLRQVLIEDVAVTQVYFEPSSKKNPRNLVKFELKQIQRKKTVDKWFEALTEEICKREIQFILVRCRVPAGIYCEINFHINYTGNGCLQEKKFEMSKKDLRCFDIFKTLVEEGPEKCRVQAYREFIIKKTDKEEEHKKNLKQKEKEPKENLMQEEKGEKYLIYSRDDICLPACEMTVRDYDFGTFEMTATVTRTRKGCKVQDISDDLMMLRQLEEDSDGLAPRKLLQVGETLELP